MKMNKTLRLMKKNLLAGLVATLAAGPGVVWAQSANATLRGSGPANTEVTAHNVATGATRRPLPAPPC